VYFVSSLTGYIVGFNGTILETTNGGSTFVSNSGTVIPGNFYLTQNYPNPFNPVTNFKFGIPASRQGGSESGIVSLKIYDLVGKEVATLVNGRLSPGTYRVRFDRDGLASGVYFYKLTTESFTDTKKMVIVK
jgi:hypothetical protein